MPHLKKHFFWWRIATSVCLDFVKKNFTCSRFMTNTNIKSRFWRKYHIAWHVLYFVRNAQSKYQAAGTRSGICLASRSTPYSHTYSKQYTVATSSVASSGSKQYTVATSSVASSSSSSSTSSPSRTYSKHQHHTATTVCSLGVAVAAPYHLYCRI